ncbi:BTAD domain-containing putative transcriptional regulator [Streptomyces sp. NPDC006692]|uniref:AfsR/SARP family transcriptional regulator n=1 Tax=unclassified Streptomyces TaxID=2593676 RepID=UPI00369BC564
MLGHFEVVAGGVTTCTPRPLKQRALLALLVSKHGQCLSVSELVRCLWDGAAPPTARAALQVYVSKLRKRMAETGCDGGSLSTSLPGYVLHLGENALDLREFRRLTHAKDAAHPEDRAGLEQESRQLQEALALWRGPALADLRDVSALRELGIVLDEAWMAAAERKLELDLLLGRELMALSELHRLALQYPEREKIQGLLMIALYRNGRAAEALATYSGLRRTLVEGLGIDPGHRLNRLHQAILNREKWLEERTNGLFAPAV